MSEAEHRKDGGPPTESAASGLVRTLENLLSRYPRDPDALDSLLHAYLHEDSRVAAAEAIGRAGVRIAAFGDARLALDVLKKLRALTPKRSEVIKAIERLRSVGEDPEPEPVVEEMRPAPAAAGGSGVPRGMHIAERLASCGMMSEGELGRVRAELDRASREVGGRAMSFWHILENLGGTDIQAKILFVARDSGIPPVPLLRFDPSPDALSLLPRTYPFELGALPFNTLANRLLVAVLDPYDEELQASVRAAAGIPCDFYLVGASEYDSALGRISEAYPEGA